MRASRLRLTRSVLLAFAVACASACLLAPVAGADEVRTPVSPIAVTFGAGGKLVATANQLGNSVSVYRTSLDGDLTQVPGSPYPTSAPQSVAFSPDGGLLAVANTGADSITEYIVAADGTLTEAPASPFVVGKSVGPHQLAFTDDGRLLVSDDNNGSIAIFRTGVRGSLTQVEGSPFGGTRGNWMAISPDGQRIATVGVSTDEGSTLSLFRLVIDGTHISLVPAKGSPYQLGGATDPTAVAFNPAGTLLAISNTNRMSISMYRVPSDPTAAPAEVPGSPFPNVFYGGNDYGVLSGVAFSANGRMLIANTSANETGDFYSYGAWSYFRVARDGRLTKYRIPDIIDDLGGRFDLGAVAFAPTGDLLAVTNADPGRPYRDVPGNLVVEPASPPLARTGTDWHDEATGATTGAEPSAPAFSPHGKWAAVANRKDNSISMFSVGDDGRPHPVAGSPFEVASFDRPSAVAFSPDGTMLATAGPGTGALNSGGVSVFDVRADGTLEGETGQLDGATARPDSVAFSPNGRLLASANADGSVSVFRVRGDLSLVPVPGSPFPAGKGATSVAFSADGHLLATANPDADSVSLFVVGDDGTLTAAPGSPVSEDHRSPVAVAFNPDGYGFAVAYRSSVASFTTAADGRLTVAGPVQSLGADVHATSLAFNQAVTSTSQALPLSGTWLAVGADHGSPQIFRVQALTDTLNKVSTRVSSAVSESVTFSTGELPQTLKPVSPASIFFLGVNSTTGAIRRYSQTASALGGAPSRNALSIMNLRASHRGRISFRLRTPGPGVVTVLVTAPTRSPSRLAFAYHRLRIRRAGTRVVALTPTRRGRRLLSGRRPLTTQLWISYARHGHHTERFGPFRLVIPGSGRG